ncbi:glycerol kinase GlpK [Candidatus Neptunochlamydia vexilliferae]|uniref:Glycerol kinase n=1 Tax=Candidatus Neptunichlamydia vexilliferae TaxID=1651774 RepID=A0ABS0AWU5_9BACT|nr:glycerol kinase GlpK [Candidatus Neptunochlamydia vexilliferae]MBF5058609.1 Glycerol kinase [Candidatus Neptunochlamydia vexilliferae]
MKYILSLDQGTTSSRALIINQEGKVLGLAQKEFTQIFPKPGWVEHDPNDIWATQASVMTEAIVHARLTLRDIGAIGITNQRETTIVWDRKTSQPLCNAIVWQDRRTTAICKMLKKEGYEPLFQKKTGLLLDPYFSGTKLKWILDNVEGARKRAEKGELAFGTVDSWLVWKMSEGRQHITDATNASRTLLYNIHEGKWDDELLSILDIPREMLPEVKSSSEVYGDCSEGVCSTEIPIGGIAGDQQAALFGHSCFKKGMGKVTYGTGCFILMNTGKEVPPSSDHLITTIAYKLGDEVHYALEGSVFIGGAVVQWLRDSLGIIRNSWEVEQLARSVPSSDGVFFVPAFTGLGAPYWDPSTRGMILGLTRGTTAAHIARAALDGIAFQVSDILDIIQKEVPIKELRVDGGAVRDDLLMQKQANLANIPLMRPKWKEVSALGAAFLAGLSIGYWKDQEEIANLWEEEKRFDPNLSDEERTNQKKQWEHAIACAKLWGSQDE